MPPVLYSFRRCPYAMRARLALYASGTAVELREVELSDKPASMLAASPKGGVPVLVLSDGQVIDESWEIMLWALHQHDPFNWLGKNDVHVGPATSLIIENDTSFKGNLDRYKYPERCPDHPQIHFRTEAERFARDLEHRLLGADYLLGDTLSIADAGVFPFIRQFAGVEKDWFAHAPYPSLRRWLTNLSGSAPFEEIMKKYPRWQPGAIPVIMSHS